MEEIKTTSEGWTRDRRGVALVLVLGLLSVLTMLAVAFSISMRVERVATHNYANDVRSREMVSVAMTRAIEKINSTMFTNCYPNWKGQKSGSRDAVASEAWPSGSSALASDIVGEEVKALVPATLWNDAESVASSCYWHTVSSGAGTNIGRVAFVIVNCSGLFDANYVGGAPQRTVSTNINELDVSILPEFSSDTNNAKVFLSDRLEHRRYETIMELATLNDGIGGTASNGIVSNFFTYSFDPGRDMMYTNKGLIGQRYVSLRPKFSVNGITNWAGHLGTGPDKYFSARFAGVMGFTNYFSNLMATLEGKGTFVTSNGLSRPRDVANGILNYIDTDRIPQTDEDDRGYTHSECVEDVPLINEIALSSYTNVLLGLTQYYFKVELWYPFVPNTVANGEFRLDISVFTNRNRGPGSSTINFDDPQIPVNQITNYASPNYSYSVQIPNMQYGGLIEFFVVTSPASAYISFPQAPDPLLITAPYNAIIGGINAYSNAFSTNIVRADTNSVRFLARVVHVLTDQVCDEATGYAVDGGTRRLLEFKDTMGYCVNDPRSNGQQHYWTSTNVLGFIYNTSSSSSGTLGKVNDNCKPFGRKGQGYPIFFRNAPMRNIGEIGHIYMGNLNNIKGMPPEDYFWQSVNILSYDFGGFLLDRFTVRPSNDVVKTSAGLVSISSVQSNVLQGLFNNMHIGETNQGGGTVLLADEIKANPLHPVNKLVSCLMTNGPYWTFQEMFTADWHGGPLGEAFRNLAPTVAETNDIQREDGLRNIVDLITFRQNIFQVILAAQVFGLDGETVVAEKRALATVYRDSYQGEFFVRSFQWLQED